MLVVAENRRRVLAFFAAVVLLVAIGFTLGRSIGSSSSTAQAVSAPAQVAVLTSLRQQLATARAKAVTASGELTVERRRDAGLRSAMAGADARLGAVHRCASKRGAKAYRHCAEVALR